MKIIALICKILVFTGLFVFIYFFYPFVFSQQEEMQLFLFKNYLIEDLLLTPGGFCTVAGQFLTQFYLFYSIAVLILAIIYYLIGYVFFLILQQIYPQKYNLLLSIVPPFALLIIQLNPGLVLDCAIGLLILFAFLYLSFKWVNSTKRYFIWIGVIPVFYFLTGQLVVLFSALFIVWAFLAKKEFRFYSLIALVLALILAYWGVRLAVYLPLTDGVYSLRYQESQLLPESFIYYAWIRIGILSVLLLLVCKLIGSLSPKRNVLNWTLTAIISLSFAGYFVMSHPDPFNKQYRLYGHLAYLKKQNDWSGIEKLIASQPKYSALELNFLNMALAQKGELLDRMFWYDQKGPQSLISPWNGTYYMSALLSDIHFYIGDISVSESYAMEALTLAKRGGSPRIMMRLIELNMLKGDWGVVKKYLSMLKEMPLYASWANEKMETILNNENASKVLWTKNPSKQLLSELETETLWKNHLNEDPFNEIAFEYLASSYLLSKDVTKLNQLLEETPVYLDGKDVPVHIQEALAIIAFDQERVISDRFVMDETCRKKYDAFRQDFVKEASKANGYLTMHQKYGNSYWFYYYCKQI